jgi:hypothetical protein
MDSLLWLLVVVNSICNTHTLSVETPELKKTAIATGVGLLAMGVIGFVVKLVHIPINNMLLGMLSHSFRGDLSNVFYFLMHCGMVCTHRELDEQGSDRRAAQGGTHSL